MLTPALFWLGKLPTYPEFLSSQTDSNLENALSDWITNGQNHIGQSLINSTDVKQLYGYIFLLNSPKNNLINPPYIGLMLTSHDSKSRNYPFILVQDISTSPNEFINRTKEFFLQQKMDFISFYPDFNETVFYNQLYEGYTNLQSMHTYHHQNNKDYWIEFYPTFAELKLTTEQLSPILYRKVMLRGY